MWKKFGRTGHSCRCLAKGNGELIVSGTVVELLPLKVPKSGAGATTLEVVVAGELKALATVRLPMPSVPALRVSVPAVPYGAMAAINGRIVRRSVVPCRRYRCWPGRGLNVLAPALTERTDAREMSGSSRSLTADDAAGPAIHCERSGSWQRRHSPDPSRVAGR